MKTIEQRLMRCPHCDRVTIHSRNVDQVNWLLHIVLALVTFGAWLVVALLLAVTSGPTSDWVCGMCGTTPPKPPFLQYHRRNTHPVTWVILGLIALSVLMSILGVINGKN